MCVGVANGSSAKLFVNGHLSAAVGFSDKHTENPIKKKKRQRETERQREKEERERDGGREMGKNEGFMPAVSHPRPWIAQLMPFQFQHVVLPALFPSLSLHQHVLGE